jgi:hypothetical protein
MLAEKYLEKDRIVHEMKETGGTFEHRLVINGDPGPWAVYTSIAYGPRTATREYRATTDYFMNLLPRVFVLTDLEPFKTDQF